MEIALALAVLLFSVVLHELGHAVVARWEGDDTAERAGRITLNPLPHLDLWGSVIVPVALFLSPGNFLFGWAKPVPVNPGNFRDPKWGDVRVSLAGITANLGLAVLCTFLMVAVLTLMPTAGAAGEVRSLAVATAEYGIFINLILAVFNLAPIPPLDGSHVVYHLLPRRWARPYREFGRYGLIALLLAVFLVPEVFSAILWPVQVLMGVADSFIGLWI